jgi:hypothetical protein
MVRFSHKFKENLDQERQNETKIRDSDGARPVEIHDGGNLGSQRSEIIVWNADHDSVEYVRDSMKELWKVVLLGE